MSGFVSEKPISLPARSMFQALLERHDLRHALPRRRRVADRDDEAVDAASAVVVFDGHADGVLATQRVSMAALEQSEEPKLAGRTEGKLDDHEFLDRAVAQSTTPLWTSADPGR